MAIFGSFIEVTPKNWPTAKEIGQRLSNTCVFRGQANKDWDLTTTIERAAKQFDISLNELYPAEEAILDRFKARAHHYLNSPPNKGELIEWLSIIQDYGGPTRLLDFTESFYIASFFAVESATAKEGACVWAISDAGLTLKAIENDVIKSDTQKAIRIENQEVLRFAETVIVDTSKCLDLVLRVTPPRLNERLAQQKGLFLFPCRLDESFENILCKTFGYSFNKLSSDNAEHIDTELLVNGIVSIGIVKINLPKITHNDVMRDLHSMNIDDSTLFPGLDGFTRSLKYYLLGGYDSIMLIK